VTPCGDIGASRILALVVLPPSFLQTAISGPVLHLLFGDKWTRAVPLLQILSIGLAFEVVPCVAGALLNAKGRFAMNLHWTLFAMPFFMASIIVGALLASARALRLQSRAF